MKSTIVQDNSLPINEPAKIEHYNNIPFHQMNESAQKRRGQMGNCPLQRAEKDGSTWTWTTLMEVLYELLSF